jgi:outer membrane receptor protein involved in Fe transport
LPTRSILTSVDVMGAERVQDKNVANSWELIGQMPGVQLTEFRLGAESGKPSFRAFNGEGYINGIKLLIDGVPSNVNSGNMRYLDMIFPLDIDYIEVVRGTNDPRYGLHNIGGNINVATRQGGNYTDGRLTVGSFNTQELQAALGRESGGFAQNYFVAKQDSDGYRDHSRIGKVQPGRQVVLHLRQRRPEGRPDRPCLQPRCRIAGLPDRRRTGRQPIPVAGPQRQRPRQPRHAAVQRPPRRPDRIQPGLQRQAVLQQHRG